MLWYVEFNHESPGHFEEDHVFPFIYAILLKGIWTSGLMNNPSLGTKVLEIIVDVLPPMVGSENLDFFIELGFHHLVKSCEFLRKFRFVLQQIQQCHTV